jgi:hypothetical protein
MRLRKVTFTGADDNIEPMDLALISDEYEWVEWGILFSENKQGRFNRYPGKNWLKKLYATAKFFREERKRAMPLSAHLCGSYAKDIVTCQECFPPYDLSIFQRIQINGSSYFLDKINAFGLSDKLPGIQVILQLKFPFNHNRINDYIVRAEELLQRDISQHTLCILHDASGGKGVLTKTWPQADPRMFCGYSGGLNPDNIEEELGKIEQVAKNCNIWIDMETGVRTDDKFDLDKVGAVINIVKDKVQC